VYSVTLPGAVAPGTRDAACALNGARLATPTNMNATNPSLMSVRQKREILMMVFSFSELF